MTVSTIYASTADGYITSSNATYSTARSGGGTVTANVSGTTMYVGQNYTSSTYYCYETFLRFTIPLFSGVQIVSATIELNLDTDSSTTDFDIKVIDVSGGYGTLDSTDFVAGASLPTTVDGTLSSASVAAGYNIIADGGYNTPIANTIVSNVDVDYMVFSDRQRANNTPSGAEYVIFKSANTTGTTSDPKLTIDTGFGRDATGLASTLAFGTPTVTVSTASQTATATGLASTVTFGTASRTLLKTVTATGLASTVAFGTATSSSALSTSATGIGSTAAVGTATSSSTYPISPSGLATTATLGTATAIPGTVTATATGLDSTVAIGTPTVSVGSSPAQTISTTGIASTEAVGTLTLTPGTVTAFATGLDSTVAIGIPTVTTGSAPAQTISVTGIGSSAAIGTLTVTPGTVTVNATGISSTVAIGSAAVGDFQLSYLLAVQLPDQAAIGQPVPLIAQLLNSAGAVQAFTSDPTIRIYSLDATTGAETDDVATTTMTQVGTTDAWRYEWTPNGSGTFVVVIAAQQGTALLASAGSISARSRFDPIALAISGQLVSRF